MDRSKKEKLVKNMTENLPVLRKKANLTQEKLASLTGVSRSTIITIENKKKMSWSMLLCLILVFSQFRETEPLLRVFEIYTEEFADLMRMW